MHTPQQKRPELFSQKALQLWSFALTLTVLMKRIKQKQHIKIQEKSQHKTKKKKNDKPLKPTIYHPFCVLEGTRIPGPLIKRIQGASFVKFQKHGEMLISSHYRKIHICTHRIICIQCNALQPLSSYSGAQKVCKNVQTSQTKPNGQINHRFYGRV